MYKLIWEDDFNVDGKVNEKIGMLLIAAVGMGITRNSFILIG